MARSHRYSRHPEFNGLDAFVWEYLNRPGDTIPCIRNITDRHGDPEQEKFMNKQIWHNKTGLDEYVAKSLGLNLKDYGTDKSKNPLYKAIANEIAALRRRGALIDWKTIKSRGTGMGVWRLDKTKLDEFAHDRIRHDMRIGDYYSNGMPHTVFARAKQNIFRAELLKEYGRCAFCRFELDDYLIGAHIVPYSVMRKENPENSMNPRNGLLLCRMCDKAFEICSITVHDDLGITVSENLREHSTGYASSWLDRIGTEIHVKSDSRYPPDPRYLGWKRQLCMYG